jgi:hypothetical protein
MGMILIVYDGIKNVHSLPFIFFTSVSSVMIVSRGDLFRDCDNGETNNIYFILRFRPWGGWGGRGVCALVRALSFVDSSTSQMISRKKEFSYEASSFRHESGLLRATSNSN